MNENTPWTFHCPVCDLPFMQEFDTHNERAHNGDLTREDLE